jgi:hypothetical protein
MVEFGFCKAVNCNSATASIHPNSLCLLGVMLFLSDLLGYKNTWSYFY